MILASLAAALFWGAAHALSPGHGKTIVTAYLVGQRGTPRHAALLGLIVTITHTIGVFALGLVTLALSQFIVPDRLYPWLNLASGLLVVGIGASVFLAALAPPPLARPRPRHVTTTGTPKDPKARASARCSQSASRAGCCRARRRSSSCLAAISLHRVAFGLLLILAFSAGLALSDHRHRPRRRCSPAAPSAASASTARSIRLVPAASALVILAAGLAMTLHAVPKVS